ncbi:MAG: hypothetical protein ACI391_08195 [Muribaculaceae bacterium]
MKLFKSSILAAIALVGFSFTACDDDNDYVPGAQSQGVYFATIPGNAIALEKDGTQFEVTVSRQGSSASNTYNITAEYNDEIFTVPSTVTFENGSNTTSIVITYDAALLGTDNAEEITLTFDEGADVCAYGLSTVTFTVSIPIDWTPWEKLQDGTGDYTYTIWFEGVDADLPVDIRTDRDNPDKAQVRISHWGNDMELFIDLNLATGECRVPQQNINDTYGDYGDVSIIDYNTYLENIGKADQQASFFDSETGLFQLLVIYQVSAGVLAYDYETFQVHGYKDFSVALNYEGILTTASNDVFATFAATIGADVTETRIAIYDANAASATDLVNGVVDGSAEYDVIEGTGAMNIRVPLYDPATYNAAIVTFANGEPKNYVTTRFVYAGSGGGDESEWTERGQGVIIDGWITSMFNFQDKDGNIIPYDKIAWPFIVEESNVNPGLYRLKDLWTTEDCHFTYLSLNQNSTPTDILLDATNPNCVKLEPQYSGFTYKASGKLLDFYVANYAGLLKYFNEMTDEQLIEAGVAEGFEGPVFYTFPWISYGPIDDVNSWGYIPVDETSDDYAFQSGIYFEFLDTEAGRPAKFRTAKHKAINLANWRKDFQTRRICDIARLHSGMPNVERRIRF